MVRTFHPGRETTRQHHEGETPIGRLLKYLMFTL